MRRTGRIFVGVGGWSYAPWRGAFYPPDLPRKSELDFMSRKLTSIEINGTFYRTQTPGAFIKWRDATPEDFVFSVKAPRYATLRKTADDARDSIARFFDSGVTELGPKLGPVLWQFTPTKPFERDFFDAFFALTPKEIDGVRIRHAIEARHESFACAEFVELAKNHGVAIAVAGDSKFPLIADPTTDFVYARIMGSSKEERKGYSATALDGWAERAKAWAEGGVAEDLPRVGKTAPEAAPRDVFVYVIRGYKERNPAAAMALIERLG